MINLLPPAYKKELRAARVNVVLRRYIIFQVIAIVLLAAMIAATFFVITMIKTNAEAEITSNQARASEYAGVETQAKQFQGNLSTAKTILDNEVRYTAVILARGTDRIRDTGPVSGELRRPGPRRSSGPRSAARPPARRPGSRPPGRRLP